MKMCVCMCVCVSTYLYVFPVALQCSPAGYSCLHFNFIFKDMKWIEEKQALYRRNQELVEKVCPASQLRVHVARCLCACGVCGRLCGLVVDLGTSSRPFCGSPCSSPRQPTSWKRKPGLPLPGPTELCLQPLW